MTTGKQLFTAVSFLRKNFFLCVVESHLISLNQQEHPKFLPPASVVRREGNSFTLLVCSQGGLVSQLVGGRGQVSQRGGGVRSASGQGGSGQPAGGGQVSQREDQVSQRGGGGQLAGGVSWQGVGSAKTGQQNEHSLHGGRYASCVHAGGLSCVNEIIIPSN